MGKIKYIWKDFNDRWKSAFSSSLWPTYYKFHLNLAVGHVNFYATPLSSKELSCRSRAVWQIKRLFQDVGVLQSHWSLIEVLSCFCQLWQPHPSNSFFSVAFCFPFSFLSSGVSLILHYFPLWSQGLLSFPVACNPSPGNAGIFLLKVHSAAQLKTRAVCNSPESGFFIALLCTA